MIPTVIERAYELHCTALQAYGPVRNRRLAYPFGVPEDMPAYEWRVSPDVYQALYEAMPPPYPMPNWKSGDDGTTRLFGWVCSPDRTLPPNSMLLEAIADADDRMGEGDRVKRPGASSAISGIDKPA